MSALIREGAKTNGFEAELARDSEESELFFETFREVILKSVWRRPSASGTNVHIPAHAFVYHENAVSNAIGFVAARGIAKIGYELWLAAIDQDRRGVGIGRRMLGEFLSTQVGKRTCVAHCAIDSPGARACAHILGSLGFTTVRVGQRSFWMARADLPHDVLNWMRTAPFASQQ
jgi:hypothetical protein